MSTNEIYVPEELKTRSRWILWKAEQREGDKKPTKIPIAPWLGHIGAISAIDPNNWADFETAKEWLDKTPEASGLGFALGDGIIGVDFDNCFKDGALEEWIDELLRENPCYAELSPSGKGLHILGFGEIPHALKTDVVEVYADGRYFTYTGKFLSTGEHSHFTNIQDIISEVYSKFDFEKVNIEALLEGCGEGLRNDSGVKIATWFRRRGMSKEETLKRMMEWNNKNNPPLRDREIEQIVESAYRREKPYGYIYTISPEKTEKERQRKKKGREETKEEEEEEEDAEELLKNLAEENRDKRYIVMSVNSRNDEGEIRKSIIRIFLNSTEPKAEVVKREKVPVFFPEDTQPTPEAYWLIKEGKSFSFSELFRELKATQGRFLYFPDEMEYDLLVLGAMISYFRDVFNTMPYFDIVGVSKNVGKTTALMCLLYSSFYGINTANLSEAVLFRMIDSCHGALGIDELDQYFANPKSNSELFGLLNAGYKRGEPAYRVEKRKDELIPVAYDAYSMKAWTRVNPLPSMLLDRAITIRMERNKGFRDITKRTPIAEDFREIRDKLYATYMSPESFEQVKQVYNELLDTETEIEGREAEKWIPMLTMAKLVDEALYEKVREYAKRQEPVEELDERTEALLYVLVENEFVGSVSSQDIKPEYEKELNSRGLLSHREEENGIKTNLITAKMKQLGFERDRRKVTHRKTWFNVDPKRLENLVRIYLPEFQIQVKKSQKQIGNEETKNSDQIFDEKSSPNSPNSPTTRENEFFGVKKVNSGEFSRKNELTRKFTREGEKGEQGEHFFDVPTNRKKNEEKEEKTTCFANEDMPSFVDFSGHNWSRGIRKGEIFNIDSRTAELLIKRGIAKAIRGDGI